MNDLKVSFETITPEMAREYLTHNAPRNRTIRSAEVQKLKQDILDGKWIVTHQGIAFDKEGVLLDGQHRLFAIVAANKPVTMMVTRGIEDQSMLVIDGGVSRSLCDRLKISGISDDRPALWNSNVQAIIFQIYKRFFAEDMSAKISADKSVEIFNMFPHVFDTVYRLCLCTVSNKSSKAIKNRFIGLAFIGAMCNGVSEQRLRAFVKCVINKEIDDALTLGCNYKSALRWEMDYQTVKGGNGSKECFSFANKAVYCFAENKQHTKIPEPYSFDLESLKWLEGRLSKKGAKA